MAMSSMTTLLARPRVLRQRSVVLWWRHAERIRKCRHHLYPLQTTVSIRQLSTSSTSSDNNNSDDPPLSKNVGTVVGAWVFCRHGDRTPGRVLCPEHRKEEEAHYWLTKLPWPSTAYAYKEFCASFPPLIDDPTGHFMDIHRNPYGFVTHKGLLQMQHNGRLLRERYDLNVSSVGDIDNKDDNNDQKIQQDEKFLKQWRISAYSTNYLRTVLSVQAFLDGLLNTHQLLYTPDQTRENMDFTSMRPQEWPVPDHDFIQTSIQCDDEDEDYDLDYGNSNSNTDDEPPEKYVVVKMNDKGYGSDFEPSHYKDPTGTSGSTSIPNKLDLHLSRNPHRRKPKLQPKVFVRVRDQSCDNLNAFDRNPDLMRDLVGDVMGSKSFQQTDAAAAPAAARLANILPGLARKGRKDFSARTPSGINWVEAADHFVCRTSHDLALNSFTDHEHDVHVEQLLSAMTFKSLEHLAWRFRQWYQNPQLLAAIAAPPLREIAQQLSQLVRTSQQQRALKQKPPSMHESQKQHPPHFMCVYSCHDVTLLALLYALGADFLADDDSGVWRKYWPAYASTLVLELVRLDDEDDVATDNDDDAPKHIMRVLINGEVVTSTDFLLSQFEREKTATAPILDEDPAEEAPPDQPLGHGPYNLLTIDDFWHIIKSLESSGEYDFSRWPAMKEESEFGKQQQKRQRPQARNNSSLNPSFN